MKHSKLVAPVVLAALLGSSCTMKDQEAPAFAGPSEFGKSVTVSISPDILTQDGASQSVVTVTARGPNGEPLANVSLRAEIQVGGVAADFGRLSAQSLVTDSNGRATVMYTAPASPAGQMVFEEASRNVTISVTPVGTDFLNSTARVATLRLLPPPGGIVVPTPQGFTATFEVTPNAPTDNQQVQFNASGSTPPQGGSITRYRWEFGDGGTGTGVSVSHAYTSPGQYTVTLVVEDNLGRTRSAARSVTVVAGTNNPTAVFSFSPTTPVSCRDVFFNASQSTAPSGRQIVAYRWVFGDGTTSDSGPTVTKRYTNATTTTYNVTLTVTDNLGRSTTSSATQITVAGSAVPCS